MLAFKKPTKHITDNSRGFSLVELLVVVAILAILAAIAIPLFLNQKAKAQSSVVLSDMRNLIPEMEAQRKTDNTFANASTIATALSTQGAQHRSNVLSRFGAYPNCTVNSATTGTPSSGNYVEWGYWGATGNGPDGGTTAYIFNSANSTWYNSASDVNFWTKWSSLATNCVADSYFWVTW